MKHLHILYPLSFPQISHERVYDGLVSSIKRMVACWVLEGYLVAIYHSQKPYL